MTPQSPPAPGAVAVPQEEGRRNEWELVSERETPPRPSAPLTPEVFVGPEVVREFLAFESIETIYRLCRAGMPHRRIGRNLRFRLSEIEEWLAGANGNAGASGSGGADQPSAARSPWLT